MIIAKARNPKNEKNTILGTAQMPQLETLTNVANNPMRNGLNNNRQILVSRERPRKLVGQRTRVGVRAI